MLAFTASGATLLPHVIGDVFLRFDSLTCRFLGEVHAGDTLDSQLQITELVLDGEHTYVLKRQAAVQGDQHG
ncbi:MAG: hypothetical protein P4L86_25045 [Mycobacterium sp.]|nr:hypothetical protein [Mycobacterium sp.]